MDKAPVRDTMNKKHTAHIIIRPHKKVYFLSDFHLSTGNNCIDSNTEKRITKFIDRIAPSAEAIFFLGDAFDFWFEYKNVIPKGCVRLQHKWLELNERNIPIYFFTGNHDQWLHSYFKQYFGMNTFSSPQKMKIGNKTMLIGHGDGLGPSDIGYKLFKYLVTCQLGKKLLYILHPDILYAVARYASSNSRKACKTEKKFLGAKREWLISYCKNYLKKDNTIDYFLFGHRHLCIDFALTEDKRYINTGDWITHYSYAQYDGKEMQLMTEDGERIKQQGTPSV